MGKIFFEETRDSGEGGIGVYVHRDTDDTDMDVGSKLLNEEKIRGKVKVMSGRPHCVGGDFVDTDFSYGFES